MRHGEQGFTFVAVLVLLVICMLGLSAAGPMWAHESKRTKEQELLRIGLLYAKALKEYRDAAPGSLAEYPQRLEQLALDDRFVGVRRHVRKLYPDPLNPGQSWGLVLNERQRIVGVYSQSAEPPIGDAPLLAPQLRLGAAHYADWKFMAEEVK
jgi:type II secretory pathway pseudopilin PulG